MCYSFFLGKIEAIKDNALEHIEDGARIEWKVAHQLSPVSIT
jgi:hypothetical protein